MRMRRTMVCEMNRDARIEMSNDTKKEEEKQLPINWPTSSELWTLLQSVVAQLQPSPSTNHHSRHPTATAVTGPSPP